MKIVFFYKFSVNPLYEISSKSIKRYLKWPIPVATRSKPWVCVRLLAGIAGSNPAEGIDCCVLWVMCIVMYSSLRRADHSTRGVLPIMRVCVCVWCHWLWSRATITSTSTNSRQTDVNTKKERKKERKKQAKKIFKMNVTRCIDLIKWSWLNACVVGYKCLSIPPTFLFSSFHFYIVLNVGVRSGACWILLY